MVKDVLKASAAAAFVAAALFICSPASAATGRDGAVVAAQILLDRAHHSPGVIDGRWGANTERAVRAFQRANGMAGTGQIDSELMDRLRLASGESLFSTYRIEAEDIKGPFHQVPPPMTGQSKLDALTYERPSEALAEKFHMAEAYLKELNPGVDFNAVGTEIRIARAGADELQREVRRVEVDKQANELRAFDESGTLVASYPTTVGSSVHPSPNEQLQVLAIAPDPTYHFDPSGRSWGPDRELTIAAGPNNPVGVVWIDLSRDGFGIHGTPEPKLIGKTSSHGCVRLTNWDARELAGAISKGATVQFL